MTLAEIDLGTPARITGFKSVSEEERLRLCALGVREKAVITKLLRTPLRDPIECLVGPQLLTIDAWLVKRIEVEAPGLGG